MTLKGFQDIIYVALYVDNNLMVGNQEAVDDAIKWLRRASAQGDRWAYGLFVLQN